MTPDEVYAKRIARLLDQPEDPRVTVAVDQYIPRMRADAASEGINVDDPAQRRAMLVALETTLELCTHIHGTSFAESHPNLWNAIAIQVRALAVLEQMAGAS